MGSLPHKLNTADCETHKRMLAKFAEAQQLQARANQLVSGVQVWSEVLHDKYELAPGDRVEDDGSIVRADG